MPCAGLGTVCVLVIAIYAYVAGHSVAMESVTRNAADSYYNLLVQAFRSGQLNLKKEVPPEFAKLADPYDPAANLPYRLRDGLHDMSYYKGKLYLYFGVTPALVLFWPYVVLTGHCLFQWQATALVCALGFLVSVGLLRAMWRRYFAEVSADVVAACALALGLATFVPVMLARCEIYEVAVSCGYLLTMLALGGIWCALHEPKRRCQWLAAASVAYGLAVAARPNLLFGAVILLVPVSQAWRERRQIWISLMAATVPITLIGLGLMLYNDLRFGNPFEFGLRYALDADHQDARQYFNLNYLWFNLRVHFLQPARWTYRFPFVQEITTPSLPAGYGDIESPFGVLTCVPVVWLALAAGLAWRDRSPESRFILHGFVTAVVLLFGICALTICLFSAASVRYEVEFLPALLLLVAVGILGLERALASRPLRRRTVRWVWGLLLGFSVAFNLLASVTRYADARIDLGGLLAQTGKLDEAVSQFEQSLRIRPANEPAHYSLGLALTQQGRLQEAIQHYQEAVKLKPDYADAHNNLGNLLAQTGQFDEAVGEYEQTLRINPDNAHAQYNLGVVLYKLGRVQEAIAHWEQALRINPDYAAAKTSLAHARSSQ